VRNISEKFDERISGGQQWSPDGRWIYFLASEKAAQRLFRIRVGSGDCEPVIKHDQQGVTGGFSFNRDHHALVVSFSDPQTPEEMYRWNPSSGELTKLTEINQAFMGTAPITETLRYRTPDGLDLEGLVIKPKDYQPGKRYPLLVIAHGGPMAAFDYAFAPRRGAYAIHTFSEQGYILFLPNVRGSTGYGDRVRRANVAWGISDFPDLMQGVGILIKQGVADPGRMGIMGWSYGGYMTAWAVTQTDRFKAASMGAGVSNLHSTWGSSDLPYSLDFYIGQPWNKTNDYMKQSPLSYVEKVTTPLLIQNGERDDRVEPAQAKQFYVALKRLGKNVQWIIYPRQGHGITEPRLIHDSLERNLHWFNRWLLGLEPPVEKAAPGKISD
jgi:dipeptidyl aminopeptidase/acylaminoacyl peptidase